MVLLHGLRGDHHGLQLVAEGRVMELSERSLTDHELRVVTADGEEVVRSDEDPVAAEDREFVDVLLGRTAEVPTPAAPVPASVADPRPSA